MKAKILRILASLAIALLPYILPSVLVEASTTADVILTATPASSGLGRPLNFTITATSDHQIDFIWTLGTGASNTLIRGKTGSYPADKNDGYQVYFGSGTSASDTGVSLDETATNIYYKAWSEGGGEYSSDYAQGNIGGEGMTLIASTLLILGLVVCALWKKDVVMYLIAGLTLLLFGYQWLDPSSLDGVIKGLPLIFLGIYMLIKVIVVQFKRG